MKYFRFSLNPENQGFKDADFSYAAESTREEIDQIVLQGIIDEVDEEDETL